MNILLLYPEKENTQKSFLDRVSSFLFTSKSENINLIEISIHLPLIWEEKLLDLNINRLSSKDISWADYVIICAEKSQTKSSAEIINRCKSMNKKLVMCGNALQPNDTEYSFIDHFVMNAAGFEVFSNDVANNCLHKTYQPIFVTENHVPFQAYSLWGMVGKFTRAIQNSPA